MLAALSENLIAGLLIGLIRLVVVVLSFCTGDIILFLLSLGHRKPFWKRDEDEPLIQSIFLIELSWWVGLLFWLAIIVIVKNLLNA